MRKRNYRDEKESKAQADIRRAKDNEAKKNKLKSETLEQKNARKTARNEKLKEKRRAKKLALAEFQSIQTVPRTLTSQVSNSIIGTKLTGSTVLPTSSGDP